MLDRLRAYLNAPTQNYYEGIQLLYALNQSNAKRDSLTQYRSESKLATYLDEEYEKLVSSHKSQVTSDKSKVESRESDIEVVSLATRNSPLVTILESNTELEDKRNILFKKLSQAHTLLKKADKNEERYEYMKQLVAIDLELADNRNDIAYYGVHGKLPIRTSLPKDKDCTPEQSQIKIRLKGLPQSIYADRKLIDKLKNERKAIKNIADIQKINAKIAKSEARLEAKEAEKRMLESQIKE
jgi:hypothetical protein